MADVPSGIGGVALAMTSGGAALEALGHRVDYLFRDDLGDWPSGPARRLIVPWRVLWAVRGLARSGRGYDLIEIHEPLSAVYAVMRGALKLPPCVVFSHGVEARHWQQQKERWRSLGQRPPLKSRVTVPLSVLLPAMLGIRCAQQVIVLNDEDGRYVREHLNVAASRITQVNNGAPAATLNVARIGAGAGQRLLFFGTWIPRKGNDLVVKIAERLALQSAPWHLTVAGTGVNDSEVLDCFSVRTRDHLEVRASVPRDEVPQLLANSDILLAPSRFEGMPLTVLEAMAAGLAVVCSDIAGHRQIFGQDPAEHGAIIVGSEDPSTWCETIVALREDSGRLQRLGAAARSRAEDMSWERAAKQLEVAYRRALAEGADLTTSSTSD